MLRSGDMMALCVTGVWHLLAAGASAAPPWVPREWIPAWETADLVAIGQVVAAGEPQLENRKLGELPADLVERHSTINLRAVLKGKFESGGEIVLHHTRRKPAEPLPAQPPDPRLPELLRKLRSDVSVGDFDDLARESRVELPDPFPANSPRQPALYLLFLRRDQEEIFVPALGQTQTGRSFQLLTPEGDRAAPPLDGPRVFSLRPQTRIIISVSGPSKSN